MPGLDPGILYALDEEDGRVGRGHDEKREVNILYGRCAPTLAVSIA